MVREKRYLKSLRNYVGKRRKISVMLLAMKILTFLFAIILLFTVNAFTQFAAPEIKVNGIGLGDSYRQVIRRLGKPLRDYTVEADECVGGRSRFLVYKGLTVEMHPRHSDPKQFYVGQLEVTSARWNVSGVRIGTGTASIRKKFGPSEFQKSEQKGEKFLPYYLNAPGNLHFYFRGARLVRIETYYIC
jgi:hypothetical protein